MYTELTSALPLRNVKNLSMFCPRSHSIQYAPHTNKHTHTHPRGSHMWGLIKRTQTALDRIGDTKQLHSRQSHFPFNHLSSNGNWQMTSSQYVSRPIESANRHRRLALFASATGWLDTQVFVLYSFCIHFSPCLLSALFSALNTRQIRISR